MVAKYMKSTMEGEPADRQHFITRRALIGTGIGAAAGMNPLRGYAQTPEFRFKCGTDAPETFPFVTYARKAAQKIVEESGGRLVVEIFPSSQLGTSTDMLSQVRSGALEMLGLQGATLSTFVPLAGINAVGFAFKDYPSVWAAMDGSLGAAIQKAFEKVSLLLPARIWDSGFRQIFSSKKQINTAEDLKNFKIRVPVSPLWLSMFNALGSSPVAINVAELYSALQTGIADGCELPISGFESLKAYEVQKYCALSNHIWDGYWPVVNAAAWRRLPTNLQEIFIKNFNAAGIEQRAYNADSAKKLETDLTQKGVVFNMPDTEQFKATLRKAGFYVEWKQKYGAEAWALLEQNVGSLT